MISATLKGYWLYRNDAVVLLEWNILLKFGFEKRGIFNKILFLHKAFHGDFWKGITSFLLPRIILDE